MRCGIFLLMLLLASTLWADVQDSLFEKALDAESAGDVPGTIALLEEANSYHGRYDAEIREILHDYYDALQIGDSVAAKKTDDDLTLDFSARAEGSGIRYDEFGDTLGAHEYSGETLLLLAADLGIHHGNYSHYLLFSFSSDVFFREKNTVFDTSRWAFSPEVEYTLSGERFSLSAGVNAVISERDGSIFAGTLSGERDFYYRKDYRAGVNGFGYLNGNWRLNLKTGVYWEFKPHDGFWSNLAFSARFDADSSVTASFARTEMQNPFESGSWEFDAEEPAEDTTWERYYLGRNWKLGPELRLLSGYRFSRIFSVDLSGYLFYSYNPRRDWWMLFEEAEDGQSHWIYKGWNRQLLQGSLRLRVSADGDVFGTYLSFGTYFRRYLGLPETHPEFYSFAYILSDLRLGVKIRF